MADPATYRPATGDIPTSPGVYRFFDADGRVIYVGKAINLRSRLANYFQDLSVLHPRTRRMVTTATEVRWVVVRNEVEALTLEYSWIKEYDPRFNVKFRDDKSYPYLAVTMGEEIPRIHVTRQAKRKTERYFGPYTHAWAIRETVDLMLRVFPVRTCSKGVYRNAERTGRPCLLGFIDKCSAPCVGRISPEDHRALAEGFCDFMAGNSGTVVRRLEDAMRGAAAAEDYELAAKYRDDLSAVRTVLEKNAAVLSDATDADLIGLSRDDLEASIQVFHVRGGRIRGQRGWVAEITDDSDDADLIERVITMLYAEGQAPREVLVPVLPSTPDQVRELLGPRVDLRVPRRGEKRTLLETVTENAAQSLHLHKLRRTRDLTARSQSLEELQEALGLDEPPLRIECFDISHVQGTNVVASMVVFEDGLPKKSAYRHYSIHGEAARDDTASMYDVITRRMRRHLRDLELREARAQRAAAARADGSAGTIAPGLQETPASGPTSGTSGAIAPGPEDGAAVPPGAAPVGGPTAAPGAAQPPETSGAETSGAETPGTTSADRELDREVPPEDPARFSYPPSLIVVDGGPPQVAAAQQAFDDLGITDVALVGLAKRLEEVWLPGDEFPVVLPRTSQALFLLQRVRDEAHRFAITYHRSKRGRAMRASELDGVPGLGPARQKALLKQFKTVAALRRATPEEMAAVEGIGPALAERISQQLGSAPEPAVNMTTGEIIE